MTHTHPSSPLALYIHIPFCETKCPYCDFNTYSEIESLIPNYIAALRKEIELWGQILDHPTVNTIFFGGGTPSYLSSDYISSLMETISDSFQLNSAIEVTLEANPGDLRANKLTAYLASRVNRLSIGVQSFDDRLLKILGRRHSAIEAINSFKMTMDAGFDNANIDLMYGLPDQSLTDWEKTLSIATELAPKHISMYCLTLEGGTPMEQWVKSGKISEPDPDVAANMYLMAQSTMDKNRYLHYEISNWAKPGKESLHNLTYWKNQPYLGIGPGAHSYLADHRFYNVKKPRDYIRKMGSAQDTLNPAVLYLKYINDETRSGATREDGMEDFSSNTSLDSNWISSVPVVRTTEFIDHQLEIAETMMMGLRLNAGINIKEFIQRFSMDPREIYGDILDELESTSLLEIVDGQIKLTSRGLLLGNEVFFRFFDRTKPTA